MLLCFEHFICFKANVIFRFFLYLLYSHFRLCINRFILVVNQEGSDLRTFISLFGICFWLI